MAKYLIIAEKKALADAILAAIPGAEKKQEGCVYKGDYIVTWASGHLLSLKPPEKYDPQLSKWELSTLPINFENWGVEVNPYSMGGTASHKVKIIGDLLKQVSAVIHAGDPDEEGQLIVDELLRWHHYKGPVYRLATGDTTRAALAKALQNMDDNKNHEADGWSAYARSVADFMVGINASRYFTLKNGVKLTVGRVQTPTLGLVVERQKLIEGHKETVYYDVYSTIAKDGISFLAKYIPDPNDSNLTDGLILDKNYAESVAAKLAGLQLDGTITEKTDLEYPPLPFDLGHLQSYCSSKFGYKISKTLDITQSLRDNYNAISYNRTDTRYLPENCYAEAPATVAQVLRNAFPTPPAGLDLSIHSKCFNDKNVEAHFAIIPQNEKVSVSSMSQEEQNVYLAIAKYYLAQFMPPAKKKKYSFSSPVPFGGMLKANETVIVEEGYLSLLGSESKTDNDGDEAKAQLHLLPVGEQNGYSIQATEISKKKTKPPAYYTQATLNEDMTRIAKYVDDPNVKKLLLEKDKDKKQENGSIGTVATRASIIEGLIKKGFLTEEKKGKTERLVATSLGKELCRILPNDLVKPNLTAYWWVIQEDIRHGIVQPSKLQENVLEMLEDIIHTEYPKIASATSQGSENGSLGTCPWCGCSVFESKMGYGCSGWKNGCKFVIWKDNKGGLLRNTHFTATDAKKLLAGQKVFKTTLCKNAGGEFSAYLLLKKEPSPYGAGFDLSFDATESGSKKSYSSRKKKK